MPSPLSSRLARGEGVRELLAEIGDPEPALADEAFARAAQHPDLAPCIDRWAPQLALAARPAFGARCLVDLMDRYRKTRSRPLSLAEVPELPALLGGSDFLARLLLRHPHWAEQLRGAPPPPPETELAEADWTQIRIAKYQGLLRITARERAGVAVPETLAELSDLADGCLRAGLECAARHENCPPPALLALGKLGGRELNFSSDVDLLFVHEPDPSSDPLAQRDRLTRLVQYLKRHMEVRSEDGFAYRVDLNLRPEGRSGALVNSVEAALQYYEAFGADWERQMLIRLRPVGGDPRAASEFCRAIQPFIYRRGIDPRAIRDVRDMKARIEQERRRAGGDLESDLKEGPGGIRDVEFFVQALQLLHGGREPRLRAAGLLDSLDALAELEIISPETRASLREGYFWLRRAEHGVQQVEERQVHHFPRDAGARLALARRMGYPDPSGAAARAALLDDWVRVREEVRHHFEALVLGSPQ